MGRSIVLLYLSVASLAFAGGAFEILLSNQSARLGHEAAHQSSNLLFDLGVDYHEKTGWAAYAGVAAVDTLASGSPIVASLGGRLYYYSSKATADTQGTLLALGGFVRYRPELLRGVAAEANLFVSPSILAFGDADAFVDAQLRLGFQALPQARLLAGYGYLAPLYGKEWRPVSEGPFLGFRINY